VDQCTESELLIWAARPGFLFDLGNSCFRSDCFTFSQFKQNLKAAKEKALDSIRKFILKDDEILKLRYYLIMHNGHIKNPTEAEHLVAGGWALKNSSSAVVCEELILEHFRSLKSDGKLEEAMISHYGTEKAALGERAVALQLVNFIGSVKQLLCMWDVKMPQNLLDFFDEFHLEFEV
jgi:hypothetical protein